MRLIISKLHISYALLLLLLSAGVSHAEDAVSLCDEVKKPIEGTRPEAYRGGMWAAPAGWILVSRDFSVPPPLTIETQAYLTRLTALMRQKNMALVMAMPPSRVLFAPQSAGPTIEAYSPDFRSKIMQGYSIRRQQLEAAGVITPDLQAATLDKNAPQDFFFKRDHHWTTAGAGYSAGLIATAIKSLPSYHGLGGQDFTISDKPAINYTGSYAERANSVCHISLAPEQHKPQITTQQGAQLLTDGDTANIVLAGTSFSFKMGHDMFNFAGALSHDLHEEVGNASVNGGGIEASLVSYTSSPAFALHRPRILIWEAPDKYNLNIATLYRQIIPAVKGACTTESALAEANVTLGTSIKLFENVAILVTGGEDFLYLETKDLSLTDFKLQFDYIGGRMEPVNLKRSTRTENTGRYFLELGMGYTGTLKSITLTPTGTPQGRITARLCRG